jgi:hypothetical protein
MVLAVVLLSASSAGAAGEHQLVVQDGVGTDIRRAAAAELDRCFPVMTAALRTSPSSTRVHIYATQDAFVRGLQEVGRLTPQTAARSGRLFTHVSANGAIFLLGPRFGAQSTYEQSYGMCLAVALTVQESLMTARRALGPHWVRQGHAWMLAQQAVLQFGLDNAVSRRERDIRGLREMRDRGGFPRLSTIETLESMQDAVDRYGGTNVSYLLRHAAAFLAGKSGPEAFAAYYRGLAITGSAPPDPAAAFRAAFQVSAEQFQQQFDAYLADLVK